MAFGSRSISRIWCPLAISSRAIERPTLPAPAMATRISLSLSVLYRRAAEDVLDVGHLIVGDGGVDQVAVLEDGRFGGHDARCRSASGTGSGTGDAISIRVDLRADPVGVDVHLDQPDRCRTGRATAARNRTGSSRRSTWSAAQRTVATRGCRAARTPRRGPGRRCGRRRCAPRRSPARPGRRGCWSCRRWRRPRSRPPVRCRPRSAPARSKPTPLTVLPWNSGPSRRKASCTMSITATEWPRRSSARASDAPTRPQPMMTMCTPRASKSSRRSLMAP